MTLEADLVQVLEPLAPGQVYPDVAPPEAGSPHIVYQQSGGQTPTFLERAVPSKQNARMSIRVWATTRAVAMALARQIEAAMTEALAFQAKPLSAPVALMDDTTNERGCTQDFTVWSDR